MLPTEQFSGDATEDKTPWTPQVWRDGPDALVAQAQSDLWQVRKDVEVGALGGDPDSRAMSGSVTQPENESDQMVDPASPYDGTGRASQWKSNLNQLRATVPLAGRAVGYDPAPGDANPAP